MAWTRVIATRKERLKLSLKEELPEHVDCLDVVLEREVRSGMTSRFLAEATG